jgi:pimeloyl-ACP methyl ester carboxylesterase
LDIAVSDEPRVRRLRLPGRSGEVAALEFGPQHRPIDIVFSHANSFNARAYRTILAPLGDALRVLAIDLRGHGRTTLPTVAEGRMGWADMREDLNVLLESLDLKGVVLSGHSLGGATSLMAAAEAPARVRSLVLFEPVILKPELIAQAMKGELVQGRMVEGAARRRAVFADRETAFKAYHGRSGFKSWSDDMLSDYLADGLLERADGEVELACTPDWEACSYRAQANDVWGAICRSACPVRVFRAEQHSTCSLDEAAAEAIDPARIRVTTIPGTTHFLPMERPELVQEALRAAAG